MVAFEGFFFRECVLCDDDELISHSIKFFTYKVLHHASSLGQKFRFLILKNIGQKRATLFSLYTFYTERSRRPCVASAVTFSKLLLPNDDVRVGRVGLAEPGQGCHGTGPLVVVLGGVGGGFVTAGGAIGSLPDVAPVDVAAAAGQGENGSTGRSAGTVFAVGAGAVGAH